jgi:hypothetical protein
VKDEMTLLREIGAVDDEDQLVRERARALLIEAIAAESGTESERRGSRLLLKRNWAVRGALAGAVALIATVLAVTLGGPGSGIAPNIVDRAAAAISPGDGIMHYVVGYTAPGISDSYEEYWINLNDPSQQRIVQTYHGAVVRQFVFTGGYSKSFEGSGNPITIITKATPPANLSHGVDPSSQGMSPVEGYRQMLISGHVRAESKTTVAGVEAYKLIVDQANVGEITYIVDAKTYFPLEYSLPRGLTDRFLKFEILPHSGAANALLEPSPSPAPYIPSSGGS